MKRTSLKISLLFASLCTAFLLLVSCSPLKSNFKNKTYYVSNDYFATATCNQTVTTTVSLQGGGVTESPQYSISTQCTVPLYQYEAEVLFYSATNELLESKHVFKSKKVDAGKAISFSVDPSEQTIQDVVFVRVLFEGRSNEKPGSNSYGHTIIFFKNNGEKPTISRVRDGGTLRSPSDPKKDNSVFDGWYTDMKLSNRFSFSTSVKSDLTLYAKYSIDAAAIANIVSKDMMRGVFKIYNRCYTTSTFDANSLIKQGSGFCFHSQDGTFYILTNYHVVEKDSKYKKQIFTIEDYRGKTYTGYIYANSQKLGNALSAEYDLACLYFTLTDQTSVNYKQFSFANGNPAFFEDIISIGAPEGQSNFFVFGKTTAYRKATLQSNSSIHIQFDVLEHNAYVAHGSSGGPLLNMDLEVVGINYAGSEPDFINPANDYALAIPVEKIKEFLNLYVFK